MTKSGLAGLRRRLEWSLLRGLRVRQSGECSDGNARRRREGIGGRENMTITFTATVFNQYVPSGQSLSVSNTIWWRSVEGHG